MHLRNHRSHGALLAFVVAMLSLGLADPCDAQPARLPWTTSRVQGSPEPPPPIVAERIFPAVKFKEPIDLTSTPSLPQLFVMELAGRIFSLGPSSATATPELCFDLKALQPKSASAYGFTFHPGFATNRHVFLCYTFQGDAPDGTRVSRFTMRNTVPPVIDPSSEELILTWPAGGHNGGCLQFGPDGLLYISTGDQASPSPPDPLTTGQDISDLLSSILRIDVGGTEPGRAYRIPRDNPFLHLPKARPEVWAYGLRNPWRMSFEPGTGSLWVGDVGWELWELIFRLDHGGINCGWSVMEGPQAVRLDQRRGPTPIEKPIAAHSHEEAASITGGYFYRGQRAPELRGAYVYADWETGRMWALRHQNGRVIERKEIASTGLKIVGFGETTEGELYFLDFVGGGIHGLRPNPAARSRDPFPTRLSETGLFTSVADQTPAPGVYEFSVTSPLWTDGAEARRWIALPTTNVILFGENYLQTPRELVPRNTVLARTVSLRTHAAHIASSRRIETQLLHFNGLDWNAYTYRWNNEQTDALLQPAGGATGTFSVVGDRLPGGEESVAWRFHSRSECLRCHNPWNGTLLGFNPVQLTNAKPPGSDHSSGQTELQRLTARGVIHIPKAVTTPTVDPHDPALPLLDRARSYLHTQCGHCHRDNAGGSVLVKLNVQAPEKEMNLFQANPVQGNLGLSGTRLLVPGAPLESLLLYRFAKAGSAHMPYLGTSLIDDRGLRLLTHWIEQLPAATNRPSSNMRDLLKLARQAVPLWKITQSAEAKGWIEDLVRSPQGTLALRIAVAEQEQAALLDDILSRLAPQMQDPLIRDLVTPLLPAKLRRQVIGSTPDISALLNRTGVADRGRALFFASSGPQCQTCHIIRGEGRALGPELSAIGKKYPKADLLKHILEPSLLIDPLFATWTADLADGESHTGCLMEQTPERVILKDAAGLLHTLPRVKIQQLTKSGSSLMPEGLLAQSTAEEVADLLEFLASQRGE